MGEGVHTKSRTFAVEVRYTVLAACECPRGTPAALLISDEARVIRIAERVYCTRSKSLWSTDTKQKMMEIDDPPSDLAAQHGEHGAKFLCGPQQRRHRRRRARHMRR